MLYDCSSVQTLTSAGLTSEETCIGLQCKLVKEQEINMERKVPSCDMRKYPSLMLYVQFLYSSGSQTFAHWDPIGWQGLSGKSCLCPGVPEGGH